MKRRLFLTGSAGAALGLVGCGGGGSGIADAAALGTTGTDAATLAGAAEGTEPSTAQRAPAQPDTQQVQAESAQVSQSSSRALPARVLACYFTGWDTSRKLTDVPLEFNVIYLFNAQNGGTNSGNGSWTWPFGRDVTPAQIQAVRQRGQKVILTVGGAGLGYNYSNRTQSTNCVNSIRAIIAGMGGVDGIDFNNYEAGIGTSATEMIWIARQLIATYGPDFAITTPAQPNSAEDLALCKAMSDAGVLTYAAPQFYDWSGFNAPGFISNRIKDWVKALGESKVAIGFSANYSNGPSMNDCIREWNASVSNHPNLRGAFCWSAQTNLSGGNAWGKTMQSLL